MSGSVPTPRGWQAMTFADVVVQGEDGIVGGPFGSSLTASDYVEAGIPVIRGSNLAGEECRFIDDRFVYVSVEKADELSRNTARPGDMIFTQRGTLGQVAVIPRVARFDRYIVSQSQMRVRVREDQFLPRFLYWYYRSPGATRYLESRTLATGVPHINLGILKEFPVRAPELPEQRRIAAILDEADALRRKRREALALLDDLLRATFLDMFGDPVTNPRGWETVKLGDLITDGPTNGLYRPASEYGRGTPIVRIDSFYDGRIANVAALKRVQIDAASVARYEIEEGQLLINRVNSPEHLGKTAIVPRLDEATVFESNMMRLSLDRARVEPGFVVFQMLSPFVRRQIANRCKDAVNQSSINQDDVRSFELRVPPLADQRRWVAIQHAQREHLTRANESLAAMERAFSSLLHRAFSGGL